MLRSEVKGEGRAQPVPEDMSGAAHPAGLRPPTCMHALSLQMQYETNDQSLCSRPSRTSGA